MGFRLLALTLAAVAVAAVAAALATAAAADTLQKIPYVVRPGAGQDAPDGAVRAACAKDFLAFCTAGSITDCMVGHHHDFQPACRAAIDRAGLAANAGNTGQATRQWACVQDARSFCANVQPGQGRVIQCLEGHLSELQPNCQTTLQAAKIRQRSL